MAGAAVGLIAFLLCVSLIPAVNAFCIRRRLFDLPGPLKIHSRPIPRLGGVAIAISLVAALVVSSAHDLATVLPFLAALALIWLAGLVDDIRGLSPIIRLAAQIAGAVFLWFGGWRLPLLGNGAIGLVGLWVFVVTFVNAFNFLDGADGLAAGVALIIAAYYIVQGGAQSELSVTISWALAGVCLGFLLWNFPPAKLFMGDSGATILGLTAAFLALNPSPTHASPSLAFCVAIFPAALPLLDAAFAIVRRLRSRASPLYGDRRHVYDLMSSRGWSARKVALSCYEITAMFCFVGYVVGWLAEKNNNSQAIAISAITVAGFVILGWRMGSLQTLEMDQASERTTALHVPNALNNSTWRSD